MHGFDGVLRGNYFGREPIRRMEVEVRVAKIKNRKVAGKDEVIGEIKKVEVVEWWTGFGGCIIWHLRDKEFV